MIRSLLLTAAGTIALTGCTVDQQDDLTRRAAKNAVRPVLAQKLPGVPVEPATDCIIDNANSKQLLSLTADAVTGPTASTVQIVTNILSQPATLTCLATKGLPVLLK